MKNFTGAIFTANTELSEAMLPQNNKMFDYFERMDPQSLLIYCIQEDNDRIIMEKSKEIKSVVNNSIIDNKSFLTMAVQLGRVDVVKALLEIGANPNGHDEEFTNPLESDSKLC